MKSCPSCSNTLSDNADRCPSCGHRFTMSVSWGNVLLVVLFLVAITAVGVYSVMVQQ